MTRRFTSLLAAASLLAACAHTPPAVSPAATDTTSPGCLSLTLRNVRAGQGPVMVAAYGDAGTFFRQPAWSARLAATTTELSARACGLSGPHAAFTAFQDLNNNGRLDMNPMGIPTEPYAISGRPLVGPPTWDRAHVPISDGATVSIAF